MLLNRKIGIDLGTSFVRVVVEDKGLVVEEPTVVAISIREKKILAMGYKASDMLGKVPEGIEARRPIRQGVIASYKITESLLSYLLQRALGQIRFSKPEVIVSIPAGITSVEERAVVEALVQAGAGKVYLLPQPVAAAIGANMPIDSSSGNMVVNIGGGTTEIAVMSMNGIVTYQSKRIAGDSINDAINNHLRKRFGLVVGEQMVEKIKTTIGSAVLLENPQSIQVRGRDGTSGMPITVNLTSNDILDPIKTVLNTIITSIKKVLETTPPELSSDIIDRGIVLTGGSAKLQNIDELLTKAIGVPVHVLEDPADAVINGIYISLGKINQLKRAFKN